MNYKLRNAYLILLVCLVSLSLSTAGRCELFQLGRCVNCFRSKPTKAGGCGDELPKTDDCVLYDRVGGAQCTWCKREYTLQVYKTGISCIKLSTLKKNCVYDLDTGKGKLTDCYQCKGGYPDQTRQTCIDFDKTSQLAKDCVTGGRNEKGQPVCTRCNPGLAVGTRSGSCIKTPVPGCLFYQEDALTCLACNVWEGYTMVDGFKCVKATGAFNA